jgi:uncharacterized phiE125 gp8 family phage protein
MPRFNVNTFHELSVSSAPVNPVVTTADMKTFMEITYADDDTLIGGFVTVATKLIEEYLNRALITQTLIAYYKSYAGIVDLPHSPIQSVTTVTQVSSDNTSTNLTANQDYYVKGVDDKYLEFAGNTYLPNGHSVRDILTDFDLKVTYVAGYGDDSTDIPEPIVDAVKRLVLRLYDYRDSNTSMGIDLLPMDVKILLEPYKNIKL